jgi:hypothetical protein
VVVVPAESRDEVLATAEAKRAEDEGQSLDDWERAHRARIDELLGDLA